MENFYTGEDFTMIRIAMGSVQDYEKFLQENQETEEFKEAILVASNNLYETLEKKNRVSEATKRAILKYKIRNAVRCTPYGLFSGVGMIVSDEKTLLKINTAKVSKRARIDMKWLFKYIKEMLRDERIMSIVKVRKNEICYVSGNRMINPYFSAKGTAEEKTCDSFSIRYTKPVQFVMEICREYISYEDVLKRVSREFCIEIERTKIFLEELIRSEFINIDIMPPLLNTDPVQYVIDKLGNRLTENNYISFLRELNCKIAGYNMTSMGEGLELYKDITNTMKSKIDINECVQVDAKINLEHQTVAKTIKREVEKTVNFLSRLAAGYSEQDYLTQYKDDFLEKYGYDTEVSILEMLDNNVGIGIPANYKNSQRKYVDYSIRNEMLDALNHIIVNKAIIAIKNNQEIIYLNDSDMDRLGKHEVRYETLLNSLDIVVQPLAKDKKDIDKGIFTLLLSGCISSAGAFNSMGRFSDMFWKDITYDNQSIEYEEELLGKEYIVAELAEIFRTGRTANVDMNMNSVPYQICIECNPCDGKKNISLNDIYIGVDRKNNRFYAKSKSLNKKIYAKTTHMLNNFFGSAAYRFLRDISSLATKFQIGEIVTSLGNSEWEYFPRIMYGKTILRPARWKYENTKEKDFYTWNEKFVKWAKENRVPDYVNYTRSDNYLRLDLRKQEYRELLYYDSLKDDVITMNEDLSSEDLVWLQDENGKKHCCEMVFPLDKKKKVHDDMHNENFLIKEKPGFFSDTSRNLFPGEEGWYYYKLYGMSGREDEFIGIELRNIVQKLSENKIIDKHFFIRYIDNRPHIRIRFHVCNKNEFSRLFFDWLIEERRKGMVTDLSLSVYERECERYGGKDLIRFAEKVFEMDSIFVEILKEKKYHHQLEMSDEEIAIWSIWGILDSFGLNLEKAEKWMSSMISRSDYREEFKRMEKTYRQSIYMKNNMSTEVQSAYKNRNKTIKAFYSGIQKSGLDNAVSSTEEDIMSSIIHMFCNRYMANNSWERALTRHTIYATLSYERFHK